MLARLAGKKLFQQHRSVTSMPQRLKTKPASETAAELPDITPAQAEFVRNILAGKTATDAYRTAFDVGDWLPSSIWCEASKLRNSPKVQQWIEASKIAGLGSTAVTYERHINELERLKALSIASGNMGAAVQCEQTIGKAAGLHVEQIRDVTKTDPVDMLRDIARDRPDIAASLAKDIGIPIEDVLPSTRTLN